MLNFSEPIITTVLLFYPHRTLAGLTIPAICLKCALERANCLMYIRDEGSPFSNNCLLLCIIPQCVCLVSELQYIAYLMLIKARYQALNQKLLEHNFGQREMENRCGNDDIDASNRNSKIWSPLDGFGRGSLACGMREKLEYRTRFNYTAKTNQLGCIYEIYLKLRRTIRMTNQSFGVQNLILILYQFVTIVELGYIVCMMMLR